jgi:hypothetical protein
MRRKIVIMLLSLAVLSLGLLMFWDPAKSKRAAALSDGEHRIDLMQQQMEEMQHQLEVMKRERGLLASKPMNTQLAPATAEAKTADPEATPESRPVRSRADLPIAVQVEQETAYFATYFSELDAKRASERPDERFDSEVRARISTIMQDVPELTESTVDIVDCGSTLCRIEATHADADAKAQFITFFTLHVAPTLNNGTIQAEPDTLKTTGYFAREGFDRPPASEAAMAAFALPEEGAP